MDQGVKLLQQKKLKWLQDYKTTIGCADCGETHPACLDFHHKNPKDKAIAFRRAIKSNWSKEHLLTEIEKCDVLCSNCHRKRHWNERLLGGSL